MLYISYGSNCNLKQMAHRCPNSERICNGELHGFRLVFNCHADIIRTDNENDIVPVVVWDIANEDWEMLDMYEGYPSYYIKETVNVILDDGEEVEAVVYVMAENRKGISPPFESYFDGIEQGYVENGIDVKYLYEALNHSWDNETIHNQYNPKEVV